MGSASGTETSVMLIVQVQGPDCESDQEKLEDFVRFGVWFASVKNGWGPGPMPLEPMYWNAEVEDMRLVMVDKWEDFIVDGVEGMC